MNKRSHKKQQESEGHDGKGCGDINNDGDVDSGSDYDDVDCGDINR